MNTGAPAITDRRHRLFHCLQAIDGLLDIRIEILHTQADPIEAKTSELLDIAICQRTRIDFDGDFTLLHELELPAQRADDFSELLGSEPVRRSSTKVQLLYPAPLKQRPHPVDLLEQSPDILFTTSSRSRDDAVTTTVKTGTAAERNVNIERQRRRSSDLSETPEVGLSETSGEVRSGRIRRITRAGAVVPAQQ